jgi:hypothetical protein
MSPNQDTHLPGPSALRRWGSREEAAIGSVRRVLLQAEENFPAEPGLSLGTWFARVQETIAVAARVTVGQIEGRRLLVEDDVAFEQAGVFADICAEAIRAAARLWGGNSAKATDEILGLVGETEVSAARPGWDELLESLARCNAALEPMANGLRDGDLPMDVETSREGLVVNGFFEVAQQAFRMVHVLCA